MTVAQIEAELDNLSLEELKVVQEAVRRERLRRHPHVLSAAETRLYKIINEPMPGFERFRELEPQWEAGTLSEAERAELLQIVEAREEANARRVEAVMELAEGRGVPFETLWHQIMGPPPQPHVA